MGAFANQLGQVMRRAAPEQGGLFSGENPSSYNANDPIVLWIIQVVIILVTTQLLSVALARIRQPRVIAEIIAGIILGPSIMGRIPGFESSIFPQASMPMLNLTSTIGLVLFLFLVGMEIDFGVVKRNAKASAAISLAGLVLPLGLGAALAVPLYHQFVADTVNFGYFILFTAVAVGITAFPVLCRILTELKLLDTTVGVVVLSAGVGNDVVGWILLALSVALVNASSGLTALWVLLTSVGYVIFLLFPVKWGFVWLAKRTGSLETGQPTAFMMTVTLLVVFISAFFTDVIGVHPIFGGFLAGLIIPHEHGFAISLVEKLEDLVSLLFLPLYFTYSGLRTNLGLLNNGITWGYVFLICVVAFFSKFIGCFTAAKLSGFNLRESGAVGSLMSCKGLVELIVLNVGLQANILDTRLFSMFVVHALILTFLTTPSTLLWYPPKYRVHADITRDTLRTNAQDDTGSGTTRDEGDKFRTRFTVVLETIEQLPAAMTLTKLLQRPTATATATAIHAPSTAEKWDEDGKASVAPTLPYEPPSSQVQITIDALRLIELTDRTSAVLKSQQADSWIQIDPVVSVFRTFGFLSGLSVTAALSVVSRDQFTASVASHVKKSGAQMVIVPWSIGSSGSGLNDEAISSSSPNPPNPFDGVFHRASGQEQTTSVVYSQFIRTLFAEIPSDVALFVDRSSVAVSSNTFGDRHLFLPFFGGPDDRLALSFVVQLCINSDVRATVIRITKTDSFELTPMNTIEDEKARAYQAAHGLAQDTVYEPRDTRMRLASETADDLLWGRFTSPARSADVAIALSRITFRHELSSRPLHTVVDLSAKDATRPLCVVTGRSRRLAVESHTAELRGLGLERGLGIGSDLIKTVGDVGAAVVTVVTSASVLVLQAA